MIEVVLSSIAIVVSVMVAVFVILRKPQKGDTGPMGPMGPKGDMGLPGRDGAAWVFRHNPDTDEYEVGYLIRTVSTDYEYSDVFYIELCDMYLADGPTRCKCVEQDSDEDDNCIYYEEC